MAITNFFLSPPDNNLALMSSKLTPSSNFEINEVYFFVSNTLVIGFYQSR